MNHAQCPVNPPCAKHQPRKAGGGGVTGEGRYSPRSLLNKLSYFHAAHMCMYMMQLYHIMHAVHVDIADMA